MLTEGFTWIPVLGIEISFRIGVLQWVLALVVSGIGALVLFYCRWYFDDDDPPTRTGAVLLAFAGAMLGLVTSDDLIGLYVFWELTTVFSYLLVGHNPTFTANRRAALTALIVTTFGGLAMLVGIVLLAVRYDNYSLSGVMAGAAASGVDSPLVVVAVLLLLVGALSKSALVPFHFWLPGAMAAPTPVSAYLHAAAMVKAGVYLVALLAPVFAGTPGLAPGAAHPRRGHDAGRRLAGAAPVRHQVAARLRHGEPARLPDRADGHRHPRRRARRAGPAHLARTVQGEPVPGRRHRRPQRRHPRPAQARRRRARHASRRRGRRSGRGVDGRRSAHARVHRQGGRLRGVDLPGRRRGRHRLARAAGGPADRRRSSPARR